MLKKQGGEVSDVRTVGLKVTRNLEKPGKPGKAEEKAEKNAEEKNAEEKKE